MGRAMWAGVVSYKRSVLTCMDNYRRSQRLQHSTHHGRRLVLISCRLGIWMDSHCNNRTPCIAVLRISPRLLHQRPPERQPVPVTACSCSNSGVGELLCHFHRRFRHRFEGIRLAIWLNALQILGLRPDAIEIISCVGDHPCAFPEGKPGHVGHVWPIAPTFERTVTFSLEHAVIFLSSGMQLSSKIWRTSSTWSKFGVRVIWVKYARMVAGFLNP